MATRENSKKGGKKDYEKKIIDTIGEEEFSKLSRGYDLLGNIAIIEFKGSKKNAKRIADILMKWNSNIHTVVEKVGAVSGKYRVRKVAYVAGKKNFVAEYKENGCTFRFDIRKVYFSNRLSFERSRILGLVKKGENIMVMFAGVGPFAIEIAKTIKETKVVAIELNSAGYKYMLENVKLNKTDNVEPVKGDVKKLSSKYRNFADRIIMPLPKSSLDFLDDAHRVAKKQAIVHLYAFSAASDPFSDIYEKVRKRAKEKGYKVKLLDKRLVRPYSANESEIVIDYQIRK